MHLYKDLYYLNFNLWCSLGFRQNFNLVLPDSLEQVKKKKSNNEAVTLNWGLFLKRLYLPFPTATDDPFTVTGGSDGRHADPVGIVNGIHQAASLRGEGSDFTVIPGWHERKTKGRQDQHIILSLQTVALLNHEGNSVVVMEERPNPTNCQESPFPLTPQTDHTWLREMSGLSWICLHGHPTSMERSWNGEEGGRPAPTLPWAAKLVHSTSCWI